MTDVAVKLPDVGEGVAEAELVELNVKVGDVVKEDDLLAAVMTDKATVEIPSPFSGTVSWIGAEVGDKIAVGSELFRLSGAQKPATSEEKPAPAKPSVKKPAEVQPEKQAGPTDAHSSAKTSRDEGRRPTPTSVHTPAAAQAARPLAAPSVRQHARDLGIDLRFVAGSGPGGRILRQDVDTHGSRPAGADRLRERQGIVETKIVGLRRRIAERMSLSKSRIPHITIVEEVDVTACEDLRTSLNKKSKDGTKLTFLPFLMRAMVRALAAQPHLNALFDDDAGIVRQHAAINIGIATQTPNGLVVPVVKNVEAKTIHECAREIDRLARRAREGSAARDELVGSTITITSLGALGAIATTPVINYPEVAIVGVNKMAIRPLWDGTTFVPRKMMNLSSSFDHRIIDGWDAAIFVRGLKDLLENPAEIFMDPQP